MRGFSKYDYDGYGEEAGGIDEKESGFRACRSSQFISNFKGYITDALKNSTSGSEKYAHGGSYFSRNHCMHREVLSVYFAPQP